MSNIEVESRVLLSPVERDEVLAYMGTLGEVKRIRRVMVDFSGVDRTRTVVLRMNDGQQSMVVKTGGLTDAVRSESEILIDPSQRLENTLGALSILGYTRAMISLRDMFVAQTDRVEYSLRDVIRPDTLERASTLLDVEALKVKPGGELDAQRDIRQEITARGLTSLNEVEWENWVNETYDTVDRAFEYTPEDVQSLVLLTQKFNSISRD